MVTEDVPAVDGAESLATFTTDGKAFGLGSCGVTGVDLLQNSPDEEEMPSLFPPFSLSSSLIPTVSRGRFMLEREAVVGGGASVSRLIFKAFSLVLFLCSLKLAVL